MSNPQKTIEQLRDEYQKLAERKIKVQANLANLKEQLRELAERAEAEFGTSDLTELRELLEKMKASNEAKRAAYQEHLANIGRELARIEREYANGPAARQEGN